MDNKITFRGKATVLQATCKEISHDFKTSGHMDASKTLKFIKTASENSPTSFLLLSLQSQPSEIRP